MKYRIIKRGDGKFLVQKKLGCFKWVEVACKAADYPDFENKSYAEWQESEQHKDYLDSVFSSLELAEDKLQKLIDREKLEKLKNQFKVVKTAKI